MGGGKMTKFREAALIRLNVKKKLNNSKLKIMATKANAYLKKQKLPTLKLEELIKFLKKILNSKGKGSMLEKLAAAMKKMEKSKGVKTPAVKAVEARVAVISKKAAAKGYSDSKVIKKAEIKAKTMVKGVPLKKAAVTDTILAGVINRKKKTGVKRATKGKTKRKKKGGGRRRGRFTQRAGSLGEFAKSERALKGWQIGALSGLAAAGLAGVIMAATGDITFSPGDIIPDSAGEDYVGREWADAEFDEMTKGMKESEIEYRFGPNAREDWYKFRDEAGYEPTVKVVEVDGEATGAMDVDEGAPTKYEGNEDGWGPNLVDGQQPDFNNATQMKSLEGSEFGDFYKEQQEAIEDANEDAKDALEERQEGDKDDEGIGVETAAGVAAGVAAAGVVASKVRKKTQRMDG